MPSVIEERFGRRLGNNDAERRYMIKGLDADDMETALDDMIAAAPATYGDLEIDELNCTVDEIPGLDWLDGTVRYKKPGADSVLPPPEPGEPIRWSGDTSGGTAHATTSISTVASYGTSPPDHNKAIGYNNGTIEGVDIVAPILRIEAVVAYEDTTQPSIAAIHAATGRTNNATWQGFAAGELLYLGASFGQRDDGVWEFKHQFLASPNRTGLSFAGQSINKKGHEYAWARFEQDEDGTAKNEVPKVRGVYVEQVYYSADFTTLGIAAS